MVENWCITFLKIIHAVRNVTLSNWNIQQPNLCEVNADRTESASGKGESALHPNKKFVVNFARSIRYVETTCLSVPGKPTV